MCANTVHSAIGSWVVRLPFALDCTNNRIENLFSCLICNVLLAGWVHSLYLSVHCSNLVLLLFRVLLVIPVLIVVELRAYFAEARFVDNFVSAKIERRPFILVIKTAIAEVDVAVSTCSICLSHRDMLRTIRNHTWIREQKNVTYAIGMIGDLCL